MATDHNFKVKNGLTVQGETLVVNHTGDLSGTQVYIKYKDSSTNLQRWGEGTSGQSTYRFRIDQDFKFIGNSGSGDNIILDSSTGNIRGTTFNVGSTQIIDSSRNLANIGTISSGAITSAEGIFGSTSSSNQGIQIKSGTGSSDYGRIRYYEGASTQRNTIHFFGRSWQGGTLTGHSTGSINLDGDYGVTFGSWNSIDAYVDGNGFHTGSGRGYYVGSTNVIDSSRNLVNIGTISSGAISAAGSINLGTATDGLVDLNGITIIITHCTMTIICLAHRVLMYLLIIKM